MPDVRVCFFGSVYLSAGRRGWRNRPDYASPSETIYQGTIVELMVMESTAETRD